MPSPNRNGANSNGTENQTNSLLGSNGANPSRLPEPGQKPVEVLPDRPLDRGEFYQMLELDLPQPKLIPVLDKQSDKTLNGIGLLWTTEYTVIIWNPQNQKWIEVLSIDFAPNGDPAPGESPEGLSTVMEDSEWQVQTVDFADENTQIEFAEPDSEEDHSKVHVNETVQKVHDFVWEFINCHYDDTDDLWYVPYTAGEVSSI